LESAGSLKERKKGRSKPVKKNRSGGRKKMWQKVERGQEVGAQQSASDASQMRCAANGTKGYYTTTTTTTTTTAAAAAAAAAAAIPCIVK
jgi:hypothetical protein